MTTALATLDINKIQNLILHGDLKPLQPAQKIEYYKNVCEMVGLNPLTKPFDYLILNGKEVLYANKNCTEQLRKVHKISLRITHRETINDVYVVTVDAIDGEGRSDSATGAVTISGLKGDYLANAFMKAETKAKRRATLSICGLGMLDETEVESIPNAQKEFVNSAPMQEQKSLPPQQQPQEVKPQPQQPMEQQAFSDGDAFDDTEEMLLGKYIVPIGKKYKGKMLCEVPTDELASFVNWLKEDAFKKGQPLQGKAAEFVDQASAYLGG